MNFEGVDAPRVLIVPGLYDSGPTHWQSRWEMLHPSFQRVRQREWNAPDCTEWLATLDAAIQSAFTPVLLVAHSAACGLVARWAATHTGPVKGALLVAPADTEAAYFPPEPTGFAPMARQRLPFPAIVVASDDDPYVTVPRAEAFAADWGARLITLHGRGHLNGDAGLGDWPEGLALLQLLAAGEVSA